MRKKRPGGDDPSLTWPSRISPAKTRNELSLGQSKRPAVDRKRGELMWRSPLTETQPGDDPIRITWLGSKHFIFSARGVVITPSLFLLPQHMTSQNTPKKTPALASAAITSRWKNSRYCQLLCAALSNGSAPSLSTTRTAKSAKSDRNAHSDFRRGWRFWLERTHPRKTRKFGKLLFMRMFSCSELRRFANFTRRCCPEP